MTPLILQGPVLVFVLGVTCCLFVAAQQNDCQQGYQGYVETEALSSSNEEENKSVESSFNAKDRPEVKPEPASKSSSRKSKSVPKQKQAKKQKRKACR